MIIVFRVLVRLFLYLVADCSLFTSSSALEYVVSKLNFVPYLASNAFFSSSGINLES